MSNISLLQKSFAANVNLWPNGQIFVQFDGFSKNIYILKKFKFQLLKFYLFFKASAEQNIIIQGINYIQSKTCIKFFYRTNQVDYVRVFKGQGCNSAV